jgi:hypothetical protein
MKNYLDPIGIFFFPSSRYGIKRKLLKVTIYPLPLDGGGLGWGC